MMMRGLKWNQLKNQSMLRKNKNGNELRFIV